MSRRYIDSKMHEDFMGYIKQVYCDSYNSMCESQLSQLEKAFMGGYLKGAIAQNEATDKTAHMREVCDQALEVATRERGVKK